MVNHDANVHKMLRNNITNLAQDKSNIWNSIGSS